MAVDRCPFGRVVFPAARVTRFAAVPHDPDARRFIATDGVEIDILYSGLPDLDGPPVRKTDRRSRLASGRCLPVRRAVSPSIAVNDGRKYTVASTKRRSDGPDVVRAVAPHRKDRGRIEGFVGTGRSGRLRPTTGFGFEFLAVPQGLGRAE